MILQPFQYVHRGNRTVILQVNSSNVKKETMSRGRSHSQRKAKKAKRKVSLLYFFVIIPAYQWTIDHVD